MISETELKWIELIKTYAPIYYLHRDEKFMPSSFDYVLPMVELDDTGRYLALKSQLRSPTERHPWFSGQGNAPMYAIIRKTEWQLRIYFYLFYPYNLGKKLAGVEFGNHVGDWEYSCITFNEYHHPVSLEWAHHGKIQTSPWAANVMMEDSHPIFFIANGSHGVYNQSGKHKYINRYLTCIYDMTNAGIRKETYKNFILITPDNYTDKQNFTYDHELKIVELNTPWGNWTTFDGFGQTTPIGTFNLFGKKVKMLDGYNRIPMSKFRD